MIVGCMKLPDMVGVEISPGIELLEQPQIIDGKLRALANVCGALAVVELKVTLLTGKCE